jgi:hypothetical protein
MKKIKKLASVGLIVLVLGFTGCGAKDSENTNDAGYSTKNTGYSTEQEVEAPQAMEEGFGGFSVNLASNSNAGAMDIENTSQKLIKNMNLTLETLEYDSLLSFLDIKIKEMKGYVEESNSYGKSLNSSSLRNAYMTVRIPSNRLDEFVNLIGENTTILARSESSQDVTRTYIATESRKKALDIQLERLFALLEKAENMEDIIVLESRISDVTYELENYASTLQNYDNLVEYSTVSIQISEVERVSNPEPTNTWDKMKNGLSDTMYQIKEGSMGFAVWFVSCLPYLIIWGIVIAVAVVLTKRIIKKKSNSSQIGSNQTGSSEITSSERQNDNK